MPVENELLPDYRRWAADPHQYGPGKIHLVSNEDDTRTLCGRPLMSFPGRSITKGNPTCKICIEAPARRERYAERREQWDRESQERERIRREERAEWWRRYDEYLRSPKWYAIRGAVMLRANGICEGCGKRKATQVHHLNYEHVMDEFLWELKAICDDCHKRVHDAR